ncbi:MAG TPA: SMC-Scp complex subunit ScpB [Candidatus Paceibacterota bacterium]
MEIEAKIEAVLFKKNGPVEIRELCSILDVKENEVIDGLHKLKENLEGRGVTLLENSTEYSLVTSKQASPIIEKMVKDEIGKDLGKAGLETLSIVLYKGPIARKEIDYIRGVNSTFILRSLMVRGLVERTESREGSRGPLYKTTSELLSFLGLSKIDDLPEYDQVKKEIDEVSKKENSINTEE